MGDVFASGRAQYCKSVPLSYKSGTPAPKSMLGSFINLDVVAILAEYHCREQPTEGPTHDPYPHPLHVQILTSRDAACDRLVLAAGLRRNPSRGPDVGIGAGPRRFNPRSLIPRDDLAFALMNIRGVEQITT